MTLLRQNVQNRWIYRDREYISGFLGLMTNGAEFLLRVI